MKLEEKNKIIEEYLEKYFNNWLINDLNIILEIIKNYGKEFTLPPILLISSGIDFLGALEYGFNFSSRLRSQNFIKDWMGKVNNIYKEDKINEFIYDIVRCGSVHQAVYKKGVEISSDNLTRKNHLKLINSSDNIFINTIQFSIDFIESQKIFRDEYIKNNINLVFNHLKFIYKTKDYTNLKTYLKTNNYKFNEIYISGSSKAADEIIFNRLK